MRPKVEYASKVWNSHTENNISCRELIQTRATNFILKSDDECLVSHMNSACYL